MATAITGYATTEVIRDLRRLEGLADSWAELHAAGDPRSPFLSWEWIWGWTRRHRDKAQPWVAVERFPDGRAAGIAPFGVVSRRGLRTIVFLGQNSGADELDLLIHPDSDSDLPQRLLESYFHSPGWDIWRLEFLRAGGHAQWAVSSTARTHRMACSLCRGEYLPILRLPATFDQLLAQRSANFRSEVRRRRKNLEKHLGEVTLDTIEDRERLKLNMPELFRLHNARRRQKYEKGIFEERSVCEFHLEVGDALARRGMARLYLLRAGGEAIAALYGFEQAGRFSFFQSGFDPKHAGLSPGTVMMSLAVEDCIRRGLLEFDYLRGEERYKRRWTEEGRYDTLIRIARGWRGQVYTSARRILLHRRREQGRSAAGGPSD
jgi:CelD/BcsL family acetyltransferase involved in cellulose biosynthesis